METNWRINSSYFIGYDDELGWGTRAFFSFYSEFQRSGRWLPIVEVVLLAAMFLVAVLANSLVLAGLCRFVRHFAIG